MKNKIVFNTWNAAFFHPGGGEIQLLNSKKYLEQKGYQIDFYNPWQPQKDIQILHQFSIQSGVEQVINAYRNLGKKIALSTIFWAEMDQTHPLFLQIQSVLNRADILLSNSDAESTKLAQIFDLDFSKFQKTRNSITEDYLNKKTKADFKKIYNIKDDFILSVANVEPRKNLHSLIMACEKLKIQIVSIGYIKDKDYYQTFLAHSLYFKQIGPISDIDILKSAYQQTLLFAMPSICETPGIAALEAASQGSKIVITTEGCTKEYFKGYATYVSPWSPEDIEKGIQRELSLNRNDDLEKYVIENYTWDKTADDIVLGYNRIL